MTLCLTARSAPLLAQGSAAGDGDNRSRFDSNPTKTWVYTLMEWSLEDGDDAPPVPAALVASLKDAVNQVATDNSKAESVLYTPFEQLSIHACDGNPSLHVPRSGDTAQRSYQSKIYHIRSGSKTDVVVTAPPPPTPR